MKLGFAQREITPAPGCPMGGYAVPRRATGVHDPLWVKVVLVAQDGGYDVLVALDLLCADSYLRQRLLARLNQTAHPPRSLLVTAIHTHSGPTGATDNSGLLAGLTPVFGVPDEAYLAWVTEQTASAYLAACAVLEPFTARAASVPAPPIGSERHSGAALVGKLTAIELLTQGGRRLIIYSLPCHPTVLGPTNLLLSADFPGVTAPALQVDQAVFLNGACGDISTRFVRRASTFEECERLGKEVALAVTDALSSQPFFSPAPMVIRSRRVTLRAREAMPVEAALSALTSYQDALAQAKHRAMTPAQLRLLESQVEGAETNLQLARNLSQLQTIQLSISAFTFCGLSFLTVPGELFSTLCPHTPDTVLCYANGYFLYIADRDAYTNGYYEALSSVFAEGEGERLMAAALELAAHTDLA